MEALGYIVLYLMLVAAGWVTASKGARFVVKLFPLVSFLSNWWQKRKEGSGIYINIEYMNVTIPGNDKEDKDKS